MKGKCALCESERELQESHIIPRFVFKWFKETSPGAIRSTQTPNLRIQDGAKLELLCADCENLISGWERAFCETIFTPFHLNQFKPVEYSVWALKFAVSVSWRVLQYYFRVDNLAHFTPEQKELAQDALLT